MTADNSQTNLDMNGKMEIRCKIDLILPDANVWNDGAAIEESRSDIVHHQSLDTPVRVEDCQGAEDGVSEGCGPHEGEDTGGHLGQGHGSLRCPHLDMVAGAGTDTAGGKQ